MTDSTDWEELQPQFRQVVIDLQHRHGKTIRELADQIPADTSTVYRLMGSTSRPTHQPDRRLHRDVERFVKDATLPRQQTVTDETDD